MFWLLLATGFTGGMTFLFMVRWVCAWLVPPPASAVHFSPKGGCADRVVQEIGRARREVLVLAYSFSSKPIAEALIAAHRRGVKVEVVRVEWVEGDNIACVEGVEPCGRAGGMSDRHQCAADR